MQDPALILGYLDIHYQLKYMTQDTGNPNLENGMNTKPTWIVELEEDPETGDLVMPIPPEVLEDLGWKIGDTLTWNVDEETGEVSLTKSALDK
jgi:hypothetical protein